MPDCMNPDCPYSKNMPIRCGPAEWGPDKSTSYEGPAFLPDPATARAVTQGMARTPVAQAAVRVGRSASRNMPSFRQTV